MTFKVFEPLWNNYNFSDFRIKLQNIELVLSNNLKSHILKAIFFFTFPHHLSKNADISSDRGAIPSLVLELLLAFFYAKLSPFSNANHNIGIVSA